MSKTVARSSTSFLGKILPLMGKVGENVVFSPYSIYSILCMTSAGAKENTLEEMAKALCIDPKVIHDEMKKMHLFCKKNENLLTVAEAVFTRSVLQGSYEKMVKKNYFALVKQTTFPNPGENQVNQFVATVTKGNIPKIVSNLDSGVSMILVNAIYFKADWEIPFKARDTEAENFSLFDGKGNVKVDMMKQYDEKAYFGSHKLSNNMEIQSCMKNYKGGKFSMLFLKPLGIKTTKEFDLVHELLMKNKSDFVEKIRKEQKYIEMKSVQIPKFKIATEMDLVDAMKTLGMKEAFTENANFSGLTKDKVFISKILHKARMDVDEKGTVAAAVTSVVMMLGCAMNFSNTVEEFILDCPFYCFLLSNDTASSTILFSAKVMNPKSKQ